MLAALSAPPMACLLAPSGCASTTLPATGILELDLAHADPRVRIRAAERALVENRVDLVGQLVGNLRDPDGAVRLFTSAALKRLTGRDFGFKPHGTVSERATAVEAWESWLGIRDDRAESEEKDPAMAQGR